MVRQHEGIWPLRLTTAMKGQITHSSFTQDWHHLSPSIFITSSHTLCYTPSLCSPSPFYSSTKLSLTGCRNLYHYLLSSYLPCLSLLSLCYSVICLPYLQHSLVSLLILVSYGWQTRFHTHITKAHTHLIGAQSQLIRAGGPSLLMNLRVIKEPLDTGVSASCF